jgi:hypothetical protein
MELQNMRRFTVFKKWRDNLRLIPEEMGQAEKPGSGRSLTLQEKI